MAITQQQYDNIMKEYAQTQRRHRLALERKRDQVYAAIPEFHALEQSVPDMGRTALQLYLAGDTDAAASVREQITAVTARKKALLTEHGFPADYLEPTYDCPSCKDTGYVDGSKCQCLRRKETAIRYDQSNLAQLFAENNFSRLREDYYRGESLTAFRTAVKASREFIARFNKDYENLYFYGTVGTGKSFLSICIAKELMDQGVEVLYFSSASLFDHMADAAFGRGGSTGAQRSTNDELYGCDCLIIDDLGTEMTNTFVLSSLFTILNARELARKSTIITTNLSLRELQERYSDRIFSRITTGFTICKLTGDDIRVIRKVRK